MSVQVSGRPSHQGSGTPKSSKKRRRIIAASIAGLVAVGGAGAYASVLTITAPGYSAGSQGLATGCDTSVTATPTLALVTGAFEVTTVTVSAVDDAACNGKTITVKALDGSNVVLATGTATVVSSPSTTSYAVDISSSHVPAATLANWAISIQ